MMKYTKIKWRKRSKRDHSWTYMYFLSFFLSFFFFCRCQNLLPLPTPPNTINTANEGRFRLNVDFLYGERAQSTVLTAHAPPSAAPGAAAMGFHFRCWACASRRQAPSSFAFTMPEEEGTFDSVSAHLLATAANIFGWAADRIKGGLCRGKCQRDKQALQIFLARLQLGDTDVVVYTEGSKLHVPAAELWKELVLDVHAERRTCHLDKHGRRCI